jgi:methylthioribose-1-phosphate isomerase
MDKPRFRSIWESEYDPLAVCILDQSLLPHRARTVELRSVDDFVRAIGAMQVRGAGLIGATAAYGVRAAALEAPDASFDAAVAEAASRLLATRPTAKNLEWALRRVLAAMEGPGTPSLKRGAALEAARGIARLDADCSRAIGLHGLPLIQRLAETRAGEPVRILTHCNAGGLAFVERGTATAPIYEAHDRGIALQVWVDETRPRNQGAALTAWELGRYGVPHNLIVDNAGGHLMQHGLVDLVIVGADRVARNGDAANKIGTYLKALAARDSGIPFYVALPSSTLDWELADGLKDIPIEERGREEVEYVEGLLEDPPGGEEPRLARVRICPEGTVARNFGFDVTPSRLITGLITERGICRADEEGILGLFPELGRPCRNEEGS